MVAKIKMWLENRWIWAGLVFLVLIGVYIRTLLPGVVGGDAGELQYAGPILALTHPTGLPLYIFVSHLWSQLVPIGSVAYRLNLLAAFSAAIGCAITGWMIARLYKRPVLGATCGLTLGLGATYWGQAVIADKYAFNTIWVALVVGLALWWAKDRQQPYGDKLLYALSLSYGISLLHHRTMLIFAFGFLILMVYNEGGVLWRRKGRTVACLAMVLLPTLIVYPLFLPWIQSRNLAPSEWQPQTVDQWIEWLLDRHEAKEAFATDDIDNQLKYYWDTLLNDYTLWVVAVAVLGMLVLTRQQPATSVFLAISFLLQGGLAANWRDNDTLFTYFLPSFMLIIYAYGHGLNFLWDKVQALLRLAAKRKDEMRLPFRFQFLPVAFAGLVLVGLPVYQFDHTYDLRYTESLYGYALVGEQTDPGVATGMWRTTLKAGDMGERLAARMDELPQDSVLLTDWEQVVIFWYYQKVEERRPDLEIVYPVEKLAWYEDGERDICVSRHIIAGEEWHPTNVGALVCLQNTPDFAVPAAMTPLGTSLAHADGVPQLELAGYRLDSTTFRAGNYVPIELVWRALADLDINYSVSLQIRTEDWQLYWKQDIQNPVIGMYPTSRWVEGEVVRDYHEFFIPLDMPAGRYIWGVVVYEVLPQGGFVNLRDSNGGEFIFGGTFEVQAR